MPHGLTAWLTAQWAAPPVRWGARLLQPLSWVYAALAGLHRSLYTLGLLGVERAPVPLLVVGNLVAGGAGKTPAVIALVGLLRAQGWTPGVISRGHGRRGGGVQAVSADSDAAEVGDEPLLIHLRTGAPVVVGADRAAAARALCGEQPAVDILLADDGLQHHRLRRDMAVWVFDERGAGNGLRLPAGPLREALPERLPPHSLVLYNAAAPSTTLPGLLGRRRLAGVLPLAAWWRGEASTGEQPARDQAGGDRARGHPTVADAPAGEAPAADALAGDAPAGDAPAGEPPGVDAAERGWTALRGRPLLAAAGLARPESFFAMLEAQGLQIVRLPLADHQRFDELPWPAGTAEVIVTEKDAVKLRPGRTGATRVWVARLDFQPEPAFADALRALCAPFKKSP
jgi:tetraacyldisaccharide 4'-kinase